MRIRHFFLTIAGLTMTIFTACNQAKTDPANINLKNTTMTSSIYDIKVVTIDGKERTLAQYKGKKMLIVNVASECGYTPQYTDLQKLHEQNGSKVVVLGFPCNDFGGQEPGSEKEITSFCQKNYGVTFPLFSKLHTKGEEQHPLYKWLSTKELNGWNSDAPTWNFCKYLIGEDGKLLKYFDKKVKPLDEAIIKEL